MRIREFICVKYKEIVQFGARWRTDSRRERFCCLAYRSILTSAADNGYKETNKAKGIVKELPDIYHTIASS
jgi:hypothetical protein